MTHTQPVGCHGGEVGQAHRVGEQRAGVGREPPVPRREHGAEPGRVHDVSGAEGAPDLGLHGGAGVVERHGRDPRALQDGRAVADGGDHQAVVGVLPVQVQLVAVRVLGDHGLQDVSWPRGRALGVVHEAEVTLHPVAAARLG
jgi:hypothetical protein